MSNFIFSLKLSRKNVIMLIFSVLFVYAFNSFLIDGPLYLFSSLSEGEISEFLINKETSRMLINQMHERLVVCNALKLISAFYLIAHLLWFFVRLHVELVLIVVPQHLLNSCSKSCNIARDGKSEL